MQLVQVSRIEWFKEIHFVKKAKERRRVGTKKRVGLSHNHPLVGTWAQVENPFHTSSAVFTIAVNKGRFLVSGMDESDGVEFVISSTKWDGKQLHFVSLFPPTNHKARHIFQILRNGQANHRVSYTDEEGRFTGDELWAKKKLRRVKA